MNSKRIAFILNDLARSPKVWLVTGVAGFIGSHLLDVLLSLEQQVVGLDNFSTGKKHNIASVLAGATAEQRKRFKFIEGSITHLDTCLRACENVDFVLHQAALGSVPRSLEDPLRTHASNVNGFLNLLVAARTRHVPRLVYASSSSVYGDEPGLPKLEQKLGNPLSPYAVTKRANELYAAVFHDCYALETIGLRYFNVFGPRQDPEGAYAAVIPRWIHAMIHNQPAIIYGDGTTSRDFCYVANIVQANLLATMSNNPAVIGEVFNIACQEQITLDELFASIRAKLLPRCPHLQNYQPVRQDFRHGDIRHSLADITKARDLLGYEPTHSVEQGLEATVNFYLGVRGQF